MKYISKWQEILDLEDWYITTEAISDDQVIYPDDIGNDRYFIGVERRKNKNAVIYYSRELEEEDIVHELLHLKYPEKSEDCIEILTLEWMYG